MVQSKTFSLNSIYLCITNTEIVQNKKYRSQNNSHSCVPLKGESGCDQDPDTGFGWPRKIQVEKKHSNF